MKKILLIIALLISGLGLNAQSVIIDDLEFTVTSETPAECEVSGYSGEPTDVTIPSTVTISEKEYTVTSIGGAAFHGCSSLTSIEIPSGVTFIGYDAFWGCSSLTSIDFGENSQLTSIVGNAFAGCSSLTSIEIPSGVTEIGGSAFSGCSSLTSIIVESGNTVYDSRDNCNAIIETATNTLIAGCQSTVIPNTVTSIGNSAFSERSSLTSIEIPSGVTSIGYSAFTECSSLTSIEIPSGVTSIGNYAFSYCSSLTSIDFGENSQLTFIGNRAFSGCSSLTSIEIPSGVTSIIGELYGGTFSECSSLTSVTFGENSQLTSIGYYAFSYCSSLTSIELPSGVTYIGEAAFEGCSSLTSIDFGENSQLTSIGAWAFSGCSSLTSIEIPSGITSIGNSAFSYCDNLTSISCHAESVPETGSNAFNYCPSDMVIYVPEQSVGAYKAASPWNEYTIMPLTDNEDPENPDGNDPEQPENPEEPDDEPEEPIELDTPENVEATATSTSSIIITWDKVENALSYNIYRDGELLDDTENTSYTDKDLEYNTEYCYTIEAVNGKETSDESEEVCVKTLGEGVEEHETSFNIYPNPVSDKLYIETLTQTQTQTQTVEIYDAFGRLQSTVNGQQSMVDVSNLNSGVYFVKVITTEGEAVKRFIKK